MEFVIHEVIKLNVHLTNFDFFFYRSGSITRGFRGEFRQFQILPGTCEASPVMANQFSVKLMPFFLSFVSYICLFPSFELKKVAFRCYLFIQRSSSWILLVLNYHLYII